VHAKVLSDRRTVGGGIAHLLKPSPPFSKLIKIVADARSEEHVYILESGYCNKSGQRLRAPGDYGFNPPGGSADNIDLLSVMARPARGASPGVCLVRVFRCVTC